MQPKQPKAETQAMSEYGEPWTIDSRANPPVVSVSGGMVFPWNYGRAIACVNALAGIPNPEAVRELIEAAKAVCSPTESEGHYAEAEEAVERIYRLEAAIESLSAPSASPQQK